MQDETRACEIQHYVNSTKINITQESGSKTCLSKKGLSSLTPPVLSRHNQLPDKDKTIWDASFDKE